MYILDKNDRRVVNDGVTADDGRRAGGLGIDVPETLATDARGVMMLCYARSRGGRNQASVAVVRRFADAASSWSDGSTG